MPYLRRREILAGVGLWAGAPLVGAFCRSMTPEALGQPLVRRRLLMYLDSLGHAEELFYQRGQGARAPVPTAEADGSVKLGGAFAALEPYRREVLFVRNLHSPFNVNGHANVWMLACTQIPGLTAAQFDTPSQPKPAPGVSIDRLIARQIGKNDLHMSVHLSGSRQGGSENLQSADGPNQRVPMESNPLTAYTRLFAAGLPIAGGDTAATAAYLARRRSLFDFLRADIARLDARLAAPERAKLGQYVDSVRAIEQRLSAQADPAKQAACARPAAPRDPGSEMVVGGMRVVDEQAAASMVDIAVAALTCGLTRVVTLTWDGEKSYPFLGHAQTGTHAMRHGGASGEPPLTSWVEMHERYFGYHARNVATIRARLGAVREGDGTVADSTLVTMMNSGGLWHHGGAKFGNQYALLVGSAGGAFKTGRFIKYPKMERSLSDLFVSIANAMGVGITRFGDQTYNKALHSGNPTYIVGDVNKGPLPGLA